MTTDTTQADTLLRTTHAFAVGCNYVLDVSQRLKTSNQYKLHHATYRDVRARTGLSSNLAIRAIARVSTAVKIATKGKKTVKTFWPTSFDLDQRIFKYREKDQTVSITTLDGRARLILDIGRYQREALAGKNPTCARVVKTDGRWFIHITIDETVPKRLEGLALGVDLGLTNIATMSTGRRISGKPVQVVKTRYARVRASLQSKGTRGAKRLLRRLSGRERRHIAWVNHNVSKDIVQEALHGGFGIIRMEDLKGIRERTRTWNKHRNRMMAGWSFAELQGFTAYKAERAGLTFEQHNPAWTSQTCHQCRTRGLRSGGSFTCVNTACGWRGHADFNAACNHAAGEVGAGEAPAVCNATRIVGHRKLHDVQAKATGL